MTDPLAERLSDATFDRRRMKRRLVWWRAVAIVAVVALIAASVLAWFGREHLPASAGGYVARVPIVGVIDDNPALTAHLEDLAANPRVQAVLVHLNSPGGTFSGSEALFHSLRRLAAAKPTVAVIGGMAASGAYMAAIATDHIVARAGSVTGSIGVILQMPQVHRLLDDLGVDIETVRSGQLKAVPSPFERVTEAGRDATEALIADLFDQFLGMVTSRRKLDEAALAEIRQGGVFTGRRGLELGLVDAIGGEEAARAWLVAADSISPDVPVIDRPVRSEENWILKMFDRVQNRARFGTISFLDGPWAIWHQ